MIVRTIVGMCHFLVLMLSDGQVADKSHEAPQLELHAIEQRILQETNERRVRFGLRPLRVDRALMKSARRHAAWMARQRVLQHTSAPVAENIALGQRTAKEALQSWMNSSGHRANILNASHRRIGVAAYRAADGRVYWCQQFTR